MPSWPVADGQTKVLQDTFWISMIRVPEAVMPGGDCEGRRILAAPMQIEPIIAKIDNLRGACCEQSVLEII